MHFSERLLTRRAHRPPPSKDQLAATAASPALLPTPLPAPLLWLPALGRLALPESVNDPDVDAPVPPLLPLRLRTVSCPFGIDSSASLLCERTRARA